MSGDGTILIVEDNPDDVFFMQRACKAAQLTNPLQVAVDGQEAINYLAGEGRFADREKFPEPCLVFLDLKLPQRTGLQVLEWVRQRPEYTALIVIILTTSPEPKDIQDCYRQGANAYLVKPSSPTRLAHMMTAIKEFWFGFNVAH